MFDRFVDSQAARCWLHIKRLAGHNVGDALEIASVFNLDQETLISMTDRG